MTPQSLPIKAQMKFGEDLNNSSLSNLVETGSDNTMELSTPSQSDPQLYETPSSEAGNTENGIEQSDDHSNENDQR